MPNRLAYPLILIVVLIAWSGRTAASAQELVELEETALRDAVAACAPSVVQIQTVGGLETVDGVLTGDGPTTGLIVSPDGYIVSSAFSFSQRPSSIIVTLPDGTRSAARQVATDHSRMLVLLKVETVEKLPVLEDVPLDDVKVGAWAIAVGRTFAADQPNMSVGIVSAVGRMYGKVIQTDAKVSPNNYGGPLIDIRGRGFGVIVPMSPGSGDEVAGLQWYDAGIGFAVPLTHVLEVLPRLKQGEDLHPGILGVVLGRGDPYLTAAKLVAVRPGSPAHQAGLKPGDEIIEVDGRPVATHTDLRFCLGPHYAGDVLHVVARRGDEKLQYDVELTDKLEPFEHAMLGILPLRTGVTGSDAGITVRYVYPGSGAEKADIRTGDVVLSIDDQNLTNVTDAVDRMNAHMPGDQVNVTVQRGDQTIKHVVTAVALPTAIPDSLPAARPNEDPTADNQGNKTENVGVSQLKLPEFKNEAQLYVPKSYDPTVSHGLVVCLTAGGAREPVDFIEQWREHCDRAGLILLVPGTADGNTWQPGDVEYLNRAMGSIVDKYTIDPARVVVHGYRAGGTMAYRLALANREQVRGVAVVDSPLGRMRRAPTNEPNQRLAVYSAQSSGARIAALVAHGVSRLQQARFPVTVVPLGDEPRYLSDEELAALVRWIDSLDRF